MSTSCSNSTVETISETSIQTESQTEPAIEYKTIDPPEDEWTLELLNQVTYIGGKQVTLPLTIEQFPDEYTVGEVTYMNQQKELWLEILHNNKYFGVAVIQNIDNKDIDYFNLPIAMLLVGCFPDEITEFVNTIVINGITFDTPIEDAMNQMGKYDNYDSEYSTYSYNYNEKNCYIEIISRPDTEKVASITIYYLRSNI
jgi:hypothetical protein